MKVKIKMPLSYYSLLVIVINEYLNNGNISSLKYSAMFEIRKDFFEVVYKNINELINIDKKLIKKNISEYSAMEFFYSFNGLQYEGFNNVVIKEFCKQIETQLFISGKYNFVKP